MCTFQRKQHFNDAASVELVCELFLRTATDYDIEVIAYCFMPDHLHALITGLVEQSNCRKCADVFRQKSGFHFRRARRTRLWQDAYYDHVLRDEDATVDVVSYIVLNPVRGGLCADASAYPFLGSSRYELAQLLTATEWNPRPLG